jgi:hypothetical protein
MQISIPSFETNLPFPTLTGELPNIQHFLPLQVPTFIPFTLSMQIFRILHALRSVFHAPRENQCILRLTDTHSNRDACQSCLDSRTHTRTEMPATSANTHAFSYSSTHFQQKYPPKLLLDPLRRKSHILISIVFYTEMPAKAAEKKAPAAKAPAAAKPAAKVPPPPHTHLYTCTFTNTYTQAHTRTWHTHTHTHTHKQAPADKKK